ncbi:integrase catalytic domain-containing protein [Trichonephila clavipes]|nr:integrase catalytic domain-containing protein [Trichonephila clavipes]
MGVLKIKQKSLRTSFTAMANKLKEYLAMKEDAKDGDKLSALNSQLQDKFLRLDEVQNKISDLLLQNTATAAEYEANFEGAEDCRDNFFEIKSKIETLLNEDSGSLLESPSERDVVKLKLPKFELKMFSAENYPKAVIQLKLRFGREDLLVQIYVSDLLSLVLKNATTGKNAPDLATVYDMLETQLRALESLGRTKEKFADFPEPLVESCLPENVL